MRRLPVPPAKIRDGSGAWPTVLWLVMLSGTLSFWPFCFDLTLVPRFFLLSAALLVSVFLVRKDLAERPETRWHIFDLLLLGWCGLNWVSVSWSLSWSEGVFFAQKPLLLFGVYWLLRQALHRDEGMVRRLLGRITLFITVCVCALLFVQIGMAALKHGLDNETLYQYASGASGNKSLAAEFLFFFVIFNGLFVVPMEKTRPRPVVLAGVFGVLFLLIFVLQVRTALVALVVGLGGYCLFRVVFETDFRKVFLQKILLTLALLVGLLVWKGHGNSMVERLNPMNYLESATANERRFVWYRTDLLNAEHYWLGVGNGAWKFWMPSKSIEGGYRLAEGNVVFTRAHNDYLEIRSEMGILGVVWFCSLFGLAFLIAIMRIKGSASLKQGILAAAISVLIVGIIRYFEIPGIGFEVQVGLVVFFALFAMSVIRKSNPGLDHDVLVSFAGLFGYCIIQYFDFPRERIEFQVVLGVLFAILAHKSNSFGGKMPPNFSPILKIWMIVLALGLAFNLLIGWERMRGEVHNVRLMDAQASGNWRRVISESQQAENNFYEYTDAAMPLAWHEGVAQFQLGQFEKSAVAFERAYRLNPWSFQVINNYASALVKLKRYSEAIPLFEKALAINPRYDEGKFNLTFVYFQMNDLARSAEWLARVDTIANPANDVDREKNRATLKRVGEFKKVLQEKQK